MLSAEENELITKVGRGTPMGELARRLWTPILLAEELPAPDCDPVRVRILGEDLVAFKDSKGPHRRPGAVVRAPRRGPLLRTERGGGPALRLPRLEVRR